MQNVDGSIQKMEIKLSPNIRIIIHNHEGWTIESRRFQ